MDKKKRSGNVVVDIMAKVNPATFLLRTAEGRSDFDDALRAEIGGIEDETLRRHAGQMIKDWRQSVLRPFDKALWGLTDEVDDY